MTKLPFISTHNGRNNDPISCLTHNGRNSPELYQDGSEAKICSKASRRLINLMKIYELYSFRLLNGKQEESLKESLCAQAVLDTAHSRNFKSLINQI
jgi:hypothetical protein